MTTPFGVFSTIGKSREEKTISMQPTKAHSFKFATTKSGRQFLKCLIKSVRFGWFTDERSAITVSERQDSPLCVLEQADAVDELKSGNAVITR